MHLKDVLEIRSALEELALELACRRVTPEQYEELVRLEALLEEKQDSDNAFELSDIDEKFHEQIYQATNNPRLVQLLANLREQMYRFRLEYMKAKDKRPRLIQEHQQIIKALKNKDSKAGRKAIYDHIVNQANAILSTLE